MVKANVDKILEYLREKKTASIGELSKKLTLKSDDIQKSAEYLEQDGVVKIEHKFPYVMVTLVKDPELPKEAMPLPPPMSRPSEKPKSNEQIGLNTNQQFDLNFQPSSGQARQMPQTTPQIPMGVPQIPQAAPPVQMSAATVNIVQPPTEPHTKKMQADASPKPVIQSAEQPSMVGPQIPQNKTPAAPKFSEVTQKHNMISAPQFQKNSENPEDPLDMPHPKFELAPPTPGENSSVRPTFVYEDGQRAEKKEVKEAHIDFPSYIQNDADKIEFLLEMIEKKIGRQDYQKLNAFYRTAYDIYNSSTTLSPNEMYLIGEKLRDKFDRLKDIYLIENAV